MFSDFLKQLRIDMKLSQRELTEKLNLADEALANLDNVTLSRWETGKTTPSLVKQIKILRTLTNDLREYLLSAENQIEARILSGVAYYRYQKPSSILSSSSYNPYPNIEKEHVTLKPLMTHPQDETLIKLNNFFHSLDIDNFPMFDVDLYQYQQENKVRSVKLIDNRNGELLGHSVSMLCGMNKIRNYYNSPALPIPMELAAPYSETSEMAIFNLTKHSCYEAVFWLNIAALAIYLVSRLNIKEMYVYAIDKGTADYFEKLGAERVSYDTPTEVGIVKIGELTFKHCLYRIDTAVWLSRPDTIELIEQYPDLPPL